MNEAVKFLSKADKKIVINCLLKAADGPFFPNWEFRTIIGVSRDEVRATAERTKNDITFGDDSWIITNVLNNLSGYPHDEFEHWDTHFSFSKNQVNAVLNKLLKFK